MNFLESLKSSISERGRDGAVAARMRVEESKSSNYVRSIIWFNRNERKVNVKSIT